MPSNILKLTTIGAFGAMLAFAAPAAADEMYSDWDTDNEQGVSQHEFDTGLGEVGPYDQWDTNGDGMLTREEFNTGLYSSYDRNQDNMLDEDEFTNYSMHGPKKTL